ncbi:hypothetical protein IDM40_21765 [Nocardiopsis sp. HNM0947]|uniref:Uncharacterized protein n=1 Tax=Nocardiopsis coralli TaxID=2772213 RepID=A0ABR9PBV4_9ACTN|nr:hypothetical protein [Nocardiopsis coralli]MBE3001299.1 hypothetical protein [Nocardiopsis coralli]
MVRTYSADDPAADLPLTSEEQAFADEVDRIREENRKNARQMGGGSIGSGKGGGNGGGNGCRE